MVLLFQIQTIIIKTFLTEIIQTIEELSVSQWKKFKITPEDITVSTMDITASEMKFLVEQIKMFTGFGLYDKDFIEVLRKLDDPTPFFRGIVAEFGFKRKEILFEQGARTAGKTSNNFYSLYDAAMLSFTSYTKIGLRIATFFGGITMIVSLTIAIVYLIMKLIWWDRFQAGMIPMLLGMLFLGSVQILFIGIVGEYVLAINQRSMKRPLVIEESRYGIRYNNNGIWTISFRRK